ncbi:hypothetical protein [Chroococcidiopsis sp.]
MTSDQLAVSCSHAPRRGTQLQCAGHPRGGRPLHHAPRITNDK